MTFATARHTRSRAPRDGCEPTRSGLLPAQSLDGFENQPRRRHAWNVAALLVSLREPTEKKLPRKDVKRWADRVHIAVRQRLRDFIGCYEPSGRGRSRGRAWACSRGRGPGRLVSAAWLRGAAWRARSYGSDQQDHKHDDDPEPPVPPSSLLVGGPSPAVVAAGLVADRSAGSSRPPLSRTSSMPGLALRVFAILSLAELLVVWAATMRCAS